MTNNKTISKVMLMIVLTLVLIPTKLVYGEELPKNNQQTAAHCETNCWEMLYQENSKDTLVHVALPNEDYLPATSLLVEDVAGATYNSLTMTRKVDSGSEVLFQSIESNIFELSQSPSSRLTIQGSNGIVPMTTISGLDTKLKNAVKKHLTLSGFPVREAVHLSSFQRENVLTPTSPGVNLQMTEALWNTFYEGSDISSPSFNTTVTKTKDYYRYVSAIQDALNEYHTDKSVWLWKSEPITDTPDETIHFLTEQSVDHLYMRFYPEIKVDDYKYFIEEAYNRGIQVHALMGSSKWGLKEYTNDALKRVDLVQAYNEKVEDHQKFVGIHFDVEPYSLDLWDTNREQVLKEWKQSANQYITHAKAYGFTVGSALPFWLDNENVTTFDRTFYEDMIDWQDYVSIMAYRNLALGSNSITSLANREVLYANLPKVEVGVELNPYKIDYVSFYGMSQTYTEREIAKVRDYFMKEQTPGFKGIAIHNYTSWKNNQ